MENLGKGSLSWKIEIQFWSGMIQFGQIRSNMIKNKLPLLLSRAGRLIKKIKNLRNMENWNFFGKNNLTGLLGMIWKIRFWNMKKIGLILTKVWPDYHFKSFRYWRTRAKNYFGPLRWLFSFTAAQTEKQSWKKFAKTSDEFAINYFSQIHLVS